MKDMDDAMLVKMTLKGDLRAFEELVDRYQKGIPDQKRVR